MSKKNNHGHYCKICGEWKANEKFSGKGHAAHICKKCMWLPVEKRNEIMTINRILELPFWLKKEQKAWLDKMRRSDNEEVRRAAEWAWSDRFDAPHEAEVDDTRFTDLTDEKLKELFDGETEMDEPENSPEEADEELPFT